MERTPLTLTGKQGKQAFSLLRARQARQSRRNVFRAKGRINNGFYDRPEVIDLAVARLQNEEFGATSSN